MWSVLWNMKKKFPTGPTPPRSTACSTARAQSAFIPSPPSISPRYAMIGSTSTAKALLSLRLPLRRRQRKCSRYRFATGKHHENAWRETHVVAKTPPYLNTSLHFHLRMFANQIYLGNNHWVRRRILETNKTWWAAYYRQDVARGVRNYPEIKREFIHFLSLSTSFLLRFHLSFLFPEALYWFREMKGKYRSSRRAKCG